MTDSNIVSVKVKGVNIILIKGRGKKIIEINIEKLVKAGMDKKKATHIVYKIAGKNEK